MARILISGSLAYDDIGTFASPWSPSTRNVKLDRLDRAFGGCAMNIAYNLAGLGHEPVPLVYAGDDYHGDYARHVTAAGISEAGIFVIPGTPSARGIVLTGNDGMQFTAFYPGPTGLQRWPADLEELLTGPPFQAAIVAPELPQKMAGFARQIRDLPLVVWCPGQYAELLGSAEVEQILEAAHLLVLNAHEWRALCALVPAQHIIELVRHIVVTDGSGPITILPDDDVVTVPAVPAEALIDPTGCGDAFVAGLVAALLAGGEMRPAVAAGAALARRCLARRGGQEHSFS
jgi:adenosine kinase